MARTKKRAPVERPEPRTTAAIWADVARVGRQLHALTWEATRLRKELDGRHGDDERTLVEKIAALEAATSAFPTARPGHCLVSYFLSSSEFVDLPEDSLVVEVAHDEEVFGTSAKGKNGEVTMLRNAPRMTLSEAAAKGFESVMVHTGSSQTLHRWTRVLILRNHPGGG